ncbi:MAG: OmpA family protein [Phycisphaeraceae bacterium]
MTMRMTGMVLAAAMLIGSGCVSQRQHDELLTLYNQVREQNTDLQTELEEAEARLAALRETGDDSDVYRQQIEEARAERDRLRAALADAEAELARAGSFMELPAELDADLAALAASNPELMTYEPERGMIRFQADLTFDLGSAEVRAGARDSLRRLAQILDSSAAAPYEVRVVGHTDNVPIANPATLERHPTNWHLSAHRAIAVKDALNEAGVGAARMNVAGYSHYRPLVPHRPGGTEQNRRVEIYLVPMTEHARAEAQRGEQSPEPVPAEGDEAFK